MIGQPISTVDQPQPLTLDICLVRQGLGRGHPLVAGVCPACGMSALFLDRAGHIICAGIHCPDPTAADQLLNFEGAAE